MLYTGYMGILHAGVISPTYEVTTMKQWLGMIGTLLLVVRSVQANDLAVLCQSGHEQSRRQIERLKCRVIIEQAPREVLNYHTKQKEKQPATKSIINWTQDGDKFHSRYASDLGISYQAVWDGKELRILHEENYDKKDKINRHGELDSSSGLSKLMETPWRLGMFGWDRLPFKLTKPWLERMEEKRTPGGQHIVAHTRVSKTLVETWFSPKQNFLIVKSVVYPNPSNTSRSFIREVTAFSEPLPGVFFPARIVSSVVRNGQAVVRDTVTIDQVSINGPIDSPHFTLVFPPNITVADNTKKVYRQTEKGGGFASDPRPFPPPRSVATPQSLPTSMQPGWFEQTWRWLVAAGLAAALALTVYVWGRFRRTPEIRV